MVKALICGGIGSGKSTACKIFEQLEVPVFYSDEAAKSLMNSNPFIIGKIKKEFGDNLYIGGQLNRKMLAEIVFNDKDKLERLNKIVHPWVGEAFKSFCCEYENEPFNHPSVHYAIEEAAIGIETGIYKDFDYVILVTADEDVRIKRVMERDGCSEESVRDRMSRQMSDEEKKQHADFVIINNDFPNLECQVNSIHKKILEYSKK
jgi:dephospho-CoA kinase